MPEPSFDANAYQAEQGREWGRSAAGWKQHWDIWEKGAQHINARLVELAHLQPGHKVIDIATGLGENRFHSSSPGRANWPGHWHRYCPGDARHSPCRGQGLGTESR